jgi:hypothetical protein
MMVPNIQGKGAMGLAQQKHRAVLLVEDDVELRGLTAKLLDEGRIRYDRM